MKRNKYHQYQGEQPKKYDWDKWGRALDDVISYFAYSLAKLIIISMIITMILVGYIFIFVL